MSRQVQAASDAKAFQITDSLAATSAPQAKPLYPDFNQPMQFAPAIEAGSADAVRYKSQWQYLSQQLTDTGQGGITNAAKAMVQSNTAGGSGGGQDGTPAEKKMIGYEASMAESLTKIYTKLNTLTVK